MSVRGMRGDLSVGLVLLGILIIALGIVGSFELVRGFRIASAGQSSSGHIILGSFLVLPLGCMIALILWSIVRVLHEVFHR